MAIGMGTYRTFDVGDDPVVRAELREVMKTFFEMQGQVIDSSPMYGPAEQVTGVLLAQVDNDEDLFAATKVWTDGKEAGIKQMQASMTKMGVEVMDLMQIHNLRDWKTHLQTLKDWKAQGKIRYTGITTSSGRNHDELARILTTESVDFVQLTYNIGNHEAEKRLLPIAADRGIAVLVNRAFEAGSLFKQVADKPLPGWAAEIDCASWAQVFLKYVISHPEVTCVIPATSSLAHVVDNMSAGFGRLPDSQLRSRMRRDFESLV